MSVEIDKDKIPNHIAVIMDGNGRWAQKKGAMRIFGHKNAMAAVRETIEGSAELGVKYITLYAFSTENWSRPQDEINALMELLVNAISDEVKNMMKNNIRLSMIGDMDSLPQACQSNLRSAMETTKENTGLRVVLALSYSGKWDMEQAVKAIVEKVVSKDISSEEIRSEESRVGKECRF